MDFLKELCTCTHCSGDCPEEVVSCPFDNDNLSLADEKDIARARRKANLEAKAKEAKAKAPTTASILYTAVATIPRSDKVRRKKAYQKAHKAERKVHN